MTSKYGGQGEKKIGIEKQEMQPRSLFVEVTTTHNSTTETKEKKEKKARTEQSRGGYSNNACVYRWFNWSCFRRRY
jgi:hypothetical protein